MFTLNEDLPESLSPGETAKGAKVSELRGIDPLAVLSALGGLIPPDVSKAGGTAKGATK